MKEYLVSYTYIDKMFRNKLGSIVVNISDDDRKNLSIPTIIINAVKNYITTNNSNVDLNNPDEKYRSCFHITGIWEL